MFPPPLSIPPQLANRRQAALNFLTARSGLLICALFLLAGLATTGEYGVGANQETQRLIAAANLNYVLGRADGILVKVEDTLVPSDRFYGVAFELPLLLAERALGLADYHYVHWLRLIITHLFFILGAFCCYRLAYRLFGSRFIALLALLFFLLHPRIYAHSFFNSKDPVFLSMFSIALYLLERAFRRDTVGAFVLLGIAVGLLTNLRIMGVMLAAAALGMRGLDLFQAGSGPERKRILPTGGLFLLSAGLTWYAVTPYAWPNPAEYLAGSLNLTVNHPVVFPQLFQGELIPSDELPPHYNATWFGITTPPPILLLGFIGMMAAVVCGGRRPGAVFRNSRRRFALLLLACFLLPPLAAALLGANQYDGWRHFYFSYAPFCLLAAGGVGWLAAALARRPGGRAGMYALVGLGLGLTLWQLAQLHPGAAVYFNFLAERATPGQLRAQYDLDYWQLAHREGLEDLLESHPGETLAVRLKEARHWEILPAAARRRLRLTAAGDRADYEISEEFDDRSRPDLAFNVRQISRYDNPLVALRPLDAARMTAAARAAYREVYRQAVAGEPIIRADYNVYRNGPRLTFVKENCPPAAPDAWFGVRPFPLVSATASPGEWAPGPYAYFSNSRVQLGDICLAVIQLPADIQGDLILTRRPLGNFWPVTVPLWEEIYTRSGPSLGEYIDRLRAGQPPAGADDFAVFLDRDSGGGYRLLYAKKGCTQDEYETRVTLHIAPVDWADLPDYRRGSGFENRDFLFDHYGGRPGGECVAAVPLPEYPMAAIRTGQGDSWSANLYPPAEPAALRAIYAALAARQPAARANFDLYLQESRLVYVRESCAAADTAAGFFLHIIPADIADLPAGRRAAGFANLDFAFERRGGHFDGRCMAVAPLPDYPMAAIRTGQYAAGRGELWAAELAVGR